MNLPGIASFCSLIKPKKEREAREDPDLPASLLTSLFSSLCYAVSYI
jgi:hypothetical protein